MKTYVHRRFLTQQAAEAAISQQHQEGNIIARLIHLPPYIFPADPNRWVASHLIDACHR